MPVAEGRARYNELREQLAQMRTTLAAAGLKFRALTLAATEKFDRMARDPHYISVPVEFAVAD